MRAKFEARVYIAYQFHPLRVWLSRDVIVRSGSPWFNYSIDDVDEKHKWAWSLGSGGSRTQASTPRLPYPSQPPTALPFLPIPPLP